jgi:hypothetical protein
LNRSPRDPSIKTSVRIGEERGNKSKCCNLDEAKARVEPKWKKAKKMEWPGDTG